MSMERDVSSYLDGNQSLEDVQILIKKLQVVESIMKKAIGIQEKRKTGADETEMEKDPADLLEDSELLPLEDFVGDNLNAGHLALPSERYRIGLYPEDFIQIEEIGSDVMAVRNSLLNFVKAIINEEQMSRTTFTSTPSPNIQNSPSRSQHGNQAKGKPGCRIQRKDSYTIHREEEGLPIEKDAGAQVTGVTSPTKPITQNSVQNNVTSDENVLAKTRYATATYSKKSSPFAVANPRQPSTMPIMSNGNASEEEPDGKYLNVNSISGLANRTLTRPSRIQSPRQNETFVNGPTKDVGFNRTAHVEANGSTKLSMEELHSMARIQQEALLSGRVLNRKETQVVSQASSFDEDEGSGSTGNCAWSNDTYSVDQSNPPSETSSGISSPPAAESYEDVQLGTESLRRSMPNLTPKNLALAPTQGMLPLQRDPRYSSDAKLSSNHRARTRTLRAPTVSISPNEIQGPVGMTQNSAMANHVEPLKKALARADTFELPGGDVNGTHSPSNINGYMTYNVRKPSYVKTSSNGSTRIPAPRRVSGDMMDSPHSGSFGFRQDLTPTGIRGVAGRVVPSQNIRNVGPTVDSYTGK